MSRIPTHDFKLVGNRNNAPSIAHADRSMETFQMAFEEATGWALEFCEPTPDTPARASRASRASRAVSGDDAEMADRRFRLTPSPRKRSDTSARQLDALRANRLAHAASILIDELDSARASLWRREAELAAGVPVSSREDEDEHLARRLEAILRGGAEAIGCRSAGLYLLDAATTELKMRSSWGLPASCLTQPARPLRDAAADLEALVGHVVAVEDVAHMRQWNVPERALAAICVPVSSPTETLGTLWMFDHQPREFTPEQTGLVEIVAGRIAAELQREMLLQQCDGSTRLRRQIEDAAHWQRSDLPNVPPMLDDWQIRGAASGSSELQTGFYDWLMPPDGSIVIAVGHSSGSMLQAAMVTSSVRAAVRSHAQYIEEPDRLVARVSDDLWEGSAGLCDTSLVIAKINPTTGLVEISSAGSSAVYVQRATRVDSLVLAGPPFAGQSDQRFSSRKLALAEGESLFICREKAEDGLLSNENLFVREPRGPIHNEDQLSRLVSSLVNASRGEQTVVAASRVR